MFTKTQGRLLITQKSSNWFQKTFPCWVTLIGTLHLAYEKKLGGGGHDDDLNDNKSHF